MYPVIKFDPIAQPTGSFNTNLPNGEGTIRIKNDSEVNVNFLVNNLASEQTLVQAGSIVDIALTPPYTFIYWNTAYKLITNAKRIAGKVTVEAYDPDETLPDNPGQLVRHFNEVNIGYGAMAQIPSDGTHIPALNVFNPLNSGKLFTFYSASYLHIGATNAAQGFLYYFIGGNINYNSTGAANFAFTNHDLSNAIPSLAIVSYTVNQNTLQAIVLIDTIDISPSQQGVRYEFIINQDQFFVYPGTNILMQGPPSSTIVPIMRFVWTETFL